MKYAHLPFYILYGYTSPLTGTGSASDYNLPTSRVRTNSMIGRSRRSRIFSDDTEGTRLCPDLPIQETVSDRSTPRQVKTSGRTNGFPTKHIAASGARASVQLKSSVQSVKKSFAVAHADQAAASEECVGNLVVAFGNLAFGDSGITHVVHT